MRLVKIASSLMVLMLVAGPMFGADDDREKVPDAKEQEKALAIIKGLFKDDYAKKKAADMLGFSDKLLKQGMESKDDPVSRYILFRESMNMAAAAGDMDKAMEAVEELAKGFQVNAPELKAALYEKAVPAAKTVDASKSLAEDIVQAIKEAIANDEFDTADRLVKVGEAAAKKAKSVALTADMAARSKEATRLRPLYAKVKDALVTLEKKPTDADANGLAGVYFCLSKGNWEKGLPMLVQAKDAKLKALAEKDGTGPDTPQAQMEMGDAWYEYAAKDIEEAGNKPHVQIRALYWYEMALPGLTGLTKTKVEKRMVELDKVADKYRDNSEFFNALRDQVKKKNYKASGLTGGGFTNKAFEEVPAEGTLLIGFNYTLPGNPSYMQPIWLTSRGEKLGQAYGKIDPKLKLMQIKAKKGYAVGGVTVRGGGGFDAFELTFMKIDKDSMKKDGSYQSAHIGGNGGGEGKYGGDGSFIVGIHGKQNNEGFMGTFGIVQMTPAKK